MFLDKTSAHFAMRDSTLEVFAIARSGAFYERYGRLFYASFLTKSLIYCPYPLDIQPPVSLVFRDLLLSVCVKRRALGTELSLDLVRFITSVSAFSAARR